MTSICWDGKTLASDSRMTTNSHITTDRCQKIYTLNNVDYLGDKLLVAAFAGCIAHIDVILNYLHSNDFTKECHIKHDMHVIIVGEKFVYLLEANESHLIRYPKSTKIADGSGGYFAESGMLLGLDAVQAVRHAMKIDSASGGKVQSWQA